MKSILIACGDKELAKKIKALCAADFNIKLISDNDAGIYDEVIKQSYDLVVAKPDLFASMKKREKHFSSDNAIKEYNLKKISDIFSHRQGNIGSFLADMRDEVFLAVPDFSHAEELLCDIYTSSVDDIFNKNEWLELYLSATDFMGSGSEYLITMLTTLYKEYAVLFPPVHSETTEQIILYILNNPESDLKQKTIASKMYVNSTYLSTVFSAQTDKRFVDYLTTVKLKRAAYLLMHTDMKINEIASRLDYKDIGYFSRLFKRQYGMLPSQYRIPDNYTYMI